MNRVYLSGMVFDEPRLVNKPDTPAHLVFLLQVKHKNKQGMQSELYGISAWNNAAMFCGQNLKQGMKVALHGYLTRRPMKSGDQLFHAVEVALYEVFLPTTAQPPAIGTEAEILADA